LKLASNKKYQNLFGINNFKTERDTQKRELDIDKFRDSEKRERFGTET
jgi:hypothetical protein